MTNKATLERAGYEGLECRLPGNRGLDGVFVKYGPQGEVKDIILLESKYAAKGRARLPKNSEGYQQMSDKWIDQQIALMSEHDHLKATVKLIKDNIPLVRRKVNVMDSAGKNRWHKLKPPATSIYKE